jgi:hypothetical protein
VREGPGVAYEQMMKVLAPLTVPGPFDDLDEMARQSAVGTVTSFLKQALELIENPGRKGGWVPEWGGLTNMRSVPSDWIAPIRFVAGQRR